MKLRLAALFLAVAGLTLSACGGGDDKAGSATTTSAAPTTSTTSQADVDRPRAQQLVLGQTDIPAGWTAEAPDADDDGSGDDTSNRINQCTGMPAVADSQVLEVKGNDFTNDRNTIGSDVTTYKTVQLVDQGFAGLTNPKNFACIAGVMDTALTASFNGGATSTSTLTKLSGITTSNSIQFALRLTTTIQLSEQTIKVYSDLLGVKDGRYQTSINVTYFDSPPPPELDKALLAAATRRLAAAPAA